MKGAFDKLLGKRIQGVVVKEGSGEPQAQIFLIFSDNTYFEIYGNIMRGTNGIDKGGLEEVRKYMAGPNREITFESVDESIKEDPINKELALDIGSETKNGLADYLMDRRLTFKVNENEQRSSADSMNLKNKRPPIIADTRKRKWIIRPILILLIISICGYYLKARIAQQDVTKLPVIFETSTMAFYDKGLFQAKKYPIKFFLGHWNYQLEDGQWHALLTPFITIWNENYHLILDTGGKIFVSKKDNTGQFEIRLMDGIWYDNSGDEWLPLDDLLSEP